MKSETQCQICKGKGIVSENCGKDFEVMSFLIPKRIMPLIKEEINRIKKIAEINTAHPALSRGLALEYICVNSALTPEESLK